MCSEELRLIGPTVELEAAYLEMAREFAAAGDNTRFATRYEEARNDFAAFVQTLNDASQGRNLPPNWVPETVYWLVEGDRLLGGGGLRHRLNEHLLNEGGHISYGIRPSERRKGYATRLLALMLERARQRFISRVLVTCDKDNVASAKVIQRNGGLLEDERTLVQTGKVKQRCLVTLP